MLDLSWTYGVMSNAIMMHSYRCGRGRDSVAISCTGQVVERRFQGRFVGSCVVSSDRVPGQRVYLVLEKRIPEVFLVSALDNVSVFDLLRLSDLREGLSSFQLARFANDVFDPL